MRTYVYALAAVLLWAGRPVAAVQLSKADHLGFIQFRNLLAIAALGGTPASVDVHREIERRLGRSVYHGSVHAALRRDLAAGRVVRVDLEARPVRGGRRRFGYALTTAGRELLREFSCEIDFMRSGVEVPD